MNRSPHLNFGKSSLFRAIATDAKLPLPGQIPLRAGAVSSPADSDLVLNEGSPEQVAEARKTTPRTLQQDMALEPEPARMPRSKIEITPTADAHEPQVSDNTETTDVNPSESDRPPTQPGTPLSPLQKEHPTIGDLAAEYEPVPPIPVPIKTAADTNDNPAPVPDGSLRPAEATSSTERALQAVQPTTLSSSVTQTSASKATGQPQDALPQPVAQNIRVTENVPLLEAQPAPTISGGDEEITSQAPHAPSPPPLPADLTRSISDVIVANVLNAPESHHKEPRQSLTTTPAKARTPPQPKPEAPKVHIGSLEIRIDAPQRAPERKKLAPVSYSGSSIASRRYLKSW